MNTEDTAQENKFPQADWREKVSLSAQVLKLSTISFWKYLSRVFIILLIGIGINIIFFVFLQNKIEYQLSHSVWGNLIAVVSVIVFFFVSPFLYFLAAHYNALQSIVYYIAHHFKTGIFEYFVDKLFAYAYHQPNIKAQLENGKIEDFFNITIPEYLQKLENMNGTLKRVFKRFTKNIDLLALFNEARQKLGGELNLESLKKYVASQAAEKVPLPLISKPTWLWVLLIVLLNTLLFVAGLLLLA